MIKIQLGQSQQIHRIGFVNYFDFAINAILQANDSFVAKVEPSKTGVFEIYNKRRKHSYLTLLLETLYFYKEEKEVAINNQEPTKIICWEICFPKLTVVETNNKNKGHESCQFSILWEVETGIFYLATKQNNVVRKVSTDYIQEQLESLDDVVFEPMIKNSKHPKNLPFSITEDW